MKTLSRNLLNFDFMSKRHIAMVLSLLLIVVSIGAFLTRGFNLGLDFTGGTLIEVRYEQPADLSLIRKQLEVAGFKNFTAVTFGTETDVLVRMQESNDPNLGDKVLAVLNQDSGANQQVEKRRIDYVGPQIGDELLNQGGMGMLTALAVMMIYIAIRFQSKFSIGAAVALIHDVIITVGCFSLFGWNFDLTVLAAVLALIGYSLNDTIVAYDRIRENLHASRKESLLAVINKSINQMLGRTINTSLTTLLVLSALFFFGGEGIHNFALALMVGVVVGTYSSVYIAASMLVLLKTTRENMIVVEREEGVYDDGMP